jgi:hypothetical protein
MRELPLTIHHSTFRLHVPRHHHHQRPHRRLQLHQHLSRRVRLRQLLPVRTFGQQQSLVKHSDEKPVQNMRQDR